MNKAHYITIFATAYLLVYLLMIELEVMYPLVYAMFTMSPMLVVYVAYAVLKYDIYNGPNLEGDEWGYQDEPDIKINSEMDREPGDML